MYNIVADHANRIFEYKCADFFTKSFLIMVHV